MNNILLINDMAGYGKVALSAMIPIMSNMKFQVYNLPTALKYTGLREVRYT